MRWALILQAAAVASLVVGELTLMQSQNWPIALLASVSTGGTTVSLLHRIVGR
jgi:hypothetical protein